MAQVKRKTTVPESEGHVNKKTKLEKGSKSTKTQDKPEKKRKSLDTKKPDNADGKTNKAKFVKGKKAAAGAASQEKPENWNEFKKKKKELREKRKQGKNSYDIICKANKIGEKLRQKNIEGGAEARHKLVAELHNLIGKEQLYGKFALAHDMARILQYMVKFGTPEIRKEIAKELIPLTPQLLQWKYGKFCVKAMLKYGNARIRSDCIKATYGHAVKLTNHGVSSSVFEYAYSSWASPEDRILLAQEFFGDMFRQSKELNIKHLRDVYKNSPDMKSAALGATKANLAKVLNKKLLDSGLVQTVLWQFLTECNNEDRTEFIAQLAPHFVVISNSRDGVRVAMQIIWHGTNKDKKVAMKALKEHVIELCKHEHGHTAIIAMLDATDDTVLLQKMVLSVILENIDELVADDWGRKVLLWLVTPADRKSFHPQFIEELEEGLKKSTCKKDQDVRRKELLSYSSKNLLTSIAQNPRLWLEQASRAMAALAILKSGSGDELKNAFDGISQTIVDLDFKLKVDEKEIVAVEDAGLHMTLKKLAMHDKNFSAAGEASFGASLIEHLTKEALESWIKLNRGCFLLVVVFENNSVELQEKLKKKLLRHSKLLKKQSSTGAKILCKKIE